MNKTLTTLLLLLLVSNIGFTQFTQIASGTSSDINSIRYKNGRLFFLGHNYLSTSDDLGSNLTQLNIPLNLTYNYALNVLDTSNLYLISGVHNPYYYYEIIHSSDGGQNWTVLFDTIGTAIHDLTVSPNGDLLAVGNFGNIFKSQDGINWTVSNANNIDAILKCENLSDNSYIIGGFEYSGLSQNNGNNWSTNYFNRSHASSIIPISNDTIYMSSYFWNGWSSFFSKSIDGGNSWSTHNMGTGIGIFDMTFESSLHGYAVGAKYHSSQAVGILMETIDGGASWRTLITEYNTEFLSVKKVEDQLFISGKDGIILKTDIQALNTKVINNQSDLIIDVYPNPVIKNSSAIVKVNQPGNYTLEVFDVAGRKVVSQSFNSEIEIQVASEGIHFVRITDDKSLSITKKLIINN